MKVHFPNTSRLIPELAAAVISGALAELQYKYGPELQVLLLDSDLDCTLFDACWDLSIRTSTFCNYPTLEEERAALMAEVELFCCLQQRNYFLTDKWPSAQELVAMDWPLVSLAQDDNGGRQYFFLGEGETHVESYQRIQTSGLEEGAREYGEWGRSGVATRLPVSVEDLAEIDALRAKMVAAETALTRKLQVIEARALAADNAGTRPLERDLKLTAFPLFYT